MLRNSVRVLVVAALVLMGWAVGRAQSAQAPQSDFEMVVSVADGGAQVTCVRGCALTWGPAVIPPTGAVDIHVPTPTLKGRITTAPDSCLAADYSRTGNCKIWGFIKR
jgi:hypothetical protein